MPQSGQDSPNSTGSGAGEGGSNPPAKPAGGGEGGQAKAHLQTCAGVILDFLQSKCLFSAERALRAELELVYQRGASDQKLMARNLWSSRLEKQIGAVLPRSEDQPELGGQGGAEASEAIEPGVVSLSRVASTSKSKSHGLNSNTPTLWPRIDQLQSGGGNSCRSTPSRRLGVRLHNLQPSATEDDAITLRRQRGRSAQQSCVVFREGLPMNADQARAVETLKLPLLCAGTHSFVAAARSVWLGALLTGRRRALLSAGTTRTSAGSRTLLSSTSTWAR